MPQAAQQPVAASRYVAFISYSHKDKSWAEWLHRELETYRVPKRLVGRRTATGVVPRRLVPIFRDRDELPSAPDLGKEVNAALDKSDHLIVICSPRAACSTWVNAEVRAFKRLGRSDRILCLVVDGEPNATDLPGRAAEECFGAALRHAIGPDGELNATRVEPIAADVRPGADGKSNAKLKLVAGLLNVGFDVLRQREWQRRVRRLTAITLLALGVTLVTAVLAVRAVIARNDAVAARDTADRRREQVENLVGFLLGDLDKKLEQVQRLDIMEAVADRAVQYVHSLPTSDVTPAALGQLAKALEKIGTVRLDQGNLPAAAASYREAARLASSLAAAQPDDVGRQIAYARVLSYVGMTDWRGGHLDAAQTSFLAARAVLTRTESHAANDTGVLDEEASTDNNIGHLFEARGRLEEAATEYRIMLTHSTQLASGKRVETPWVARLGMAHNNLGKIALLRGDLADAVGEYAANEAIDAALSARDPADNDERENLLSARAILGRTEALAGDLETGIDKLKSAVDIADDLVKVDPNNSSFQEDLALYSAQLGTLERLAGNAAGARQLVDRSLTIFAALTLKDASNADWQEEFVAAQLERATQLLNAGRGVAAQAQGEEVLKALSPWVAQRPEDRDLLLMSVGAKVLVARCGGVSASANSLRREAVQSLRAMRGGGADPRVLAVLAEALVALGEVDAAKPVIQQLWESGYRDAGFVAVLNREHVAYAANPAFQQRMRAALAGAASPRP